MKRLAAIVLFVALLCVLAFILFRGDEDEVGLRDGDGLSVVTEQGLPQRHAGVREDGDDKTVTALASGSEDVGSELVVVGQGGPPGDYRVRCIDAVTEEGVAGAEFWCMEEKGVDAAYVLARQGLQARIAANGIRYLADANGEVAIPSHSRLIAVATKDDLVGFIRPGRSESRDGCELLRMFPRRNLRVRVDDIAGQPVADVPVFLALDPLDERAGHRTLQIIPTDSLGIAEFRLNEIDSLHAFGQAYLKLAAGGESSSQVVVDVVDPPEETVVMTMSATGKVVVDFDIDSLPPGSRGRFGMFEVCELQQVIGKSPVEFSGLPLGKRAFFTVETPRDEVVAFKSIEFDGPKEEGEVVRVSFDIGTPIRRSILQLRLVDELGLPLKRTSVELISTEDERTIMSFKSDAEGLFRGSCWKSGNVRLVTSWTAGPKRVSQILDLDSSPGVHDLGDVELAFLPAMASGRVMDQSGKPLGGIRVQLSGVKQGVRQLYWSGLGGGFTIDTTDAEGRFSLSDDASGLMADATLRLDLTGQGFDHRRVTCLLGSSELLVELTASAVLTLKLDGADEGAYEGLKLRLRSTESAARGIVLDPRPDDEGRVSFDFIEPGRYDIDLFRQVLNGPAEPQALMHWPGQVFVSGQVTDLGMIRVQEPANVVRVRLRPGSGMLLPAVSWSVLEARRGGPKGLVDLRRKPTIRFLAATLPVTLRLDFGRDMIGEYEILGFDTVITVEPGDIEKR